MKHVGCGLEFFGFVPSKGPLLSQPYRPPSEALHLTAQLWPGLFLFPLFLWLPSMALPLVLRPTVLCSKLSVLAAGVRAEEEGGSCGEGSRLGACPVHFSLSHWPLFAFPAISLVPD